MMRKWIIAGSALLLLASAVPAAAAAVKSAPALQAQAAPAADAGEEAALYDRLNGFMQRENIPNGGIYLEQGVFVVNVAGLTDDIEAKFSQAFDASSYKLHNVTYTLAQLEAAQQALADHDLYRKAGIFASGPDLYKNRLLITLNKATADEGKKMIEAVVDPALLAYELADKGPVPLDAVETLPAPLPLPAIQQEKPDVSGAVRKIFTAYRPGTDAGRQIIGSIVVGPNSKASLVYITQQTQLVKLDKGREVPAAWSDIAAGTKVDVTLKGPYLLIYPLKADAVKVVIKG